MSDPMKDLDELMAINDKRTASGLTPFADDGLAQAKQWLAAQEAKPTAEAGADAAAQAAKQAEEAKAGEAAAKVAVAEENAEAEPAPLPVSERKQADGGSRVAELEKELQRLKSEAGRSSVLANELKELRAELESAKRRADEAEAAAQEAAASADGGILAGLSQEERDAIDPTSLKAIEKYVRKLIGVTEADVATKLSATEKRLAEREDYEARQLEAQAQKASAAMWKEVAKTVPPSTYKTFGEHPQWEAWNFTPYAGSTYGALYASAIKAADTKAVTELLQGFMRFAGIDVPAKGNPPPLKVTEQKGGSAPSNQAPEVFYELDIQRVEDGFAQGRLPQGWTQKDFDAWAKRVDDARYDGRVKAGSAPR